MSSEKKIVKVKRNNYGDIVELITEHGEEIPLNHAILMVKQGEIGGYTVIRGKNGGEFLRVDPNNSDAEDLDDLPTLK